MNVSALKGEGIDELLENITLLTEMGEYRAPVKRHAEGFVMSTTEKDVELSQLYW